MPQACITSAGDITRRKPNITVTQFNSPQANITEKSTCRSKCFFLGGGWWIRTTEGVASRFTVCPLWPLGKSPIFDCQLRYGSTGAGGRIRTPDLLITNQLLYQLSYTSIFNLVLPTPDKLIEGVNR